MWSNMEGSSRTIYFSLSNSAPTGMKNGINGYLLGNAAIGGEEVRITIFMGNSNVTGDDIDYSQYSLEEYINMVGAHEGTHATEHNEDTPVKKADDEANDQKNKSKNEIDSKSNDERGILTIRKW